MPNPIEALKQRQGNQSLRMFARQIPCSPAYLSDVMRGQRPAGPRILKFLGWERQQTITYRKPRKVHGQAKT